GSSFDNYLFARSNASKPAKFKSVKFLSAIRSPEARSGTRNISRGYLALFATVIIWSLPSLFQFYLLRSEEHTSELQSPDHLVCLPSLPSLPTRRSSDLAPPSTTIFLRDQMPVSQQNSSP